MSSKARLVFLFGNENKLPFPRTGGNWWFGKSQGTGQYRQKGVYEEHIFIQARNNTAYVSSLGSFLCQLRNKKQEQSEVKQVAAERSYNRQSGQFKKVFTEDGKTHTCGRYTEKKTCRAERGLRKPKHPVFSEGLGIFKPLKRFPLLI